MLGLKKSSSLESLQTAVQEVLDDGAPAWKPNATRSMVRGRGCNDSFRAAVDRSYDTGAPTGETMETLEEEESSEGGSVAHGHSMCESAQSSFSGSDNLAVGLADESRKGKKKLKKDSKDSKDKDKDKDKEKEKDKGGLFKGLGHMFRFGRHRKPLDPPNDQSSKNDVMNQDPGRQRQDEVERHQARQAAQDEHDRIHEQYRRLQEKQQQINAANRLREDHLRNMHPAALDTSGHEGDNPALASLSRAERIQHLRSEHQRRHRERQGQYPLDAQEEAYEHQLQEYEKQRRLAESGYRDSYPVPPRRPSETGADQYERPQSRVGYAPPADPGRYSHYQNYNEIQAQLTTHDRYQAMYQHYMAHQMAAAAAAAAAGSEQQRARAKTPEPTRSAPLVDPMDSRGGSGIGYPRSQSTVDARAWHPASHQHAQHLKHVQQHMQQHVQVVRPRSQTPQLPYAHHSAGKAPVAMLPQQILVSNGPPHEHYHQHRSHQHHSTRDSAVLYADPTASSATGSYPADHGYGSLHRRRDDRGQNGVVSGPAQV